MPRIGAGAPDGWLMALVPVMFSYSGWNAAVYVAEEIRDPVRNVPRALAIGTGAIVALYLALNALYLRVVPLEQFSGSVGGRRSGGRAAVRIRRRRTCSPSSRS